ncbi:MAG: MBL fold metallo-hydrolase [Chloroflexota bacterium]|nr:MBL fold metallo-hydrolase [Chloroflexota bacterium]
MMFELVFLGTSASAPSIYRGLPALAVLAGEQRFLVDCGEGTQRQILRSGIGFKRLNRIFLTHAHLDHILGLGGLLSTFGRWEALDEIHIWGGLPAIERVQALVHQVVFRRQTPPVPIYFYRAKPGETLFQGRNFSVRAFPVSHRGRECYGYIFEEDARRPFLADKAEALGLPQGPERGRLVAGESVLTPAGRVVHPDEVLGGDVRGAKVVITGDLARTDDIRDAVQDADALVIESTYLDRHADIAREVGHITARQAAELARDCDVKYLFLTHISRRYREFEVIGEVRKTFPDSYVVRDLDHFAVFRDKLPRKLEAPVQANAEDDLPEEGE